jgi:hypothetical protein
MKLSKGDAVTYVALVISAALQALEPWRKEASVPPDTHPILSSSVWAYIPLALLIAVGCIWLYRQIIPLFKGHPASDQVTASVQSKLTERSIKDSHYLKEANVYAGSLSSSPELFPYAVVCFGRSGRDADVCVDYSYYANGPWTQRRRLLLKNVPSFRRDERATITIMYRDAAEGRIMWRWGDAQVKYPNRDEGFLGPNRHLRCRISFIFPDETEEYAYFIVETGTSAELMPTVIGKHMFDFVDQWERE